MTESPRAGALIGVIAAFVILGFPLVYVIWEAVNAALSFNVSAIRWTLVLPALAAFIVLLVVLSRVVRGYAGTTGAS